MGANAWSGVGKLPDGFSDLEPFVAYWAVDTLQERWDRRAQAPMDEIRRFYDAMVARAEAALAYVDQFPVCAMPEQAALLGRLLLALANVSMAVEMHGQPRVPHSPYPHGVRVIRGPAPFG